MWYSWGMNPVKEREKSLLLSFLPSLFQFKWHSFSVPNFSWFCSLRMIQPAHYNLPPPLLCLPPLLLSLFSLLPSLPILCFTQAPLFRHLYLPPGLSIFPLFAPFQILFLEQRLRTQSTVITGSWKQQQHSPHVLSSDFPPFFSFHRSRSISLLWTKFLSINFSAVFPSFCILFWF